VPRKDSGLSERTNLSNQQIKNKESKTKNGEQKPMGWELRIDEVWVSEFQIPKFRRGKIQGIAYDISHNSILHD
jgi:hypothetical protein